VSNHILNIVAVGINLRLGWRVDRVTPGDVTGLDTDSRITPGMIRESVSNDQRLHNDDN
jgi:hypothetical protein